MRSRAVLLALCFYTTYNRFYVHKKAFFLNPHFKQCSHIIKNKMQTIDKRDQCAIYTHDRKFLFHLPRETFKHGKQALPQNIAFQAMRLANYDSSYITRMAC